VHRAPRPAADEGAPIGPPGGEHTGGVHAVTVLSVVRPSVTTRSPASTGPWLVGSLGKLAKPVGGAVVRVAEFVADINKGITEAEEFVFKILGKAFGPLEKVFGPVLTPLRELVGELRTFLRKLLGVAEKDGAALAEKGAAAAARSAPHPDVAPAPKPAPRGVPAPAKPATRPTTPYREPSPPAPEQPFFPPYEKPAAPPAPPTPGPVPVPEVPRPREPVVHPPTRRRIDPGPFTETPGTPPPRTPDVEVDPRFRKPVAPPRALEVPSPSPLPPEPVKTPATPPAPRQELPDATQTVPAPGPKPSSAAHAPESAAPGHAPAVADPAVAHKESVEEFLARGGQVRKLPPAPGPETPDVTAAPRSRPDDLSALGEGPEVGAVRPASDNRAGVRRLRSRPDRGQVRPAPPSTRDAPRERIFAFREAMADPQMAAAQEEILELARTNPQEAGRRYEKLIAGDLPGGTDVENAFRRPGRRMDIGTEHEVTIEGRDGPFGENKLDQLWDDLVDKGNVTLTVPRLSDAARDQLERMAAQATQLIPRPTVIVVRETLP